MFALAGCGQTAATLLMQTPADIRVSAASLDFGNVVVHASSTMTLTVENRGEQSGQVGVGAPSGSGAASFSVSPQGTFTLAGGQQRQITVTYSPVAAPSADVAAFVVQGPAMPARVSLRGAGVQAGLEIMPNPLDFNFVQPFQSRSLPLRLRNVGGVSVDVSSVSISDDDVDGGSPAFLVSPSSPGVIAPGDSIELSVTFAPPVCAVSRANLLILADFGTVIVPLTGFGGGAYITCAPATLDFGSVACGVATSLPIICTNAGTEFFGDAGSTGMPLWSVSSSAPEICQVSGPDGGALLAGQFVQLDVHCKCPPGYDGGDVTLTVSSPTSCGMNPTLTVSGVCGGCN
jgi:hypothetical protein